MQNSKPAAERASSTGSESGGSRSENLVVVRALFGFLSSTAAIAGQGPVWENRLCLFLVGD